MIFEFPVKNYYAKVYDLEKTSFDVLATRFIERYMPRSFDLKIHEGVVEAIRIAKQKGYQNILLSASEENNLKKQVDHYKIGHLFDAILGTSDVYASSKIEVALNFIKENHIDQTSCIMIGDTLHDAEVAEALGIKIILYTKGHQHPKRLMHLAYINHFSDLIGRI